MCVTQNKTPCSNFLKAIQFSIIAIDWINIFIFAQINMSYGKLYCLSIGTITLQCDDCNERPIVLQYSSKSVTNYNIRNDCFINMLKIYKKDNDKEMCIHQIYR